MRQSGKVRSFFIIRYIVIRSNNNGCIQVVDLHLNDQVTDPTDQYKKLVDK
jgi:hypothetical protein